MAYGHREKGSCEDIELVVPPARASAGAITAAADGLKFLGKTPLSAAVRQAAESLKYTEDKATVILITDGVETCNADPCAVGTELEQAGIDFTAHVVGFGLTAEAGQGGRLPRREYRRTLHPGLRRGRPEARRWLPQSPSKPQPNPHRAAGPGAAPPSRSPRRRRPRRNSISCRR